MFLQLWNQKDEIAKHLMTFRSFPRLSEASLRDGRRQPVSLWCSGAVSQFPSYALTALPYFWTDYNYTIKFLMNASPSDISQMVFMTSLFPKRSRFLFITREGWRSSRQHCRPAEEEKVQLVQAAVGQQHCLLWPQHTETSLSRKRKWEYRSWTGHWVHLSNRGKWTHK